MEVTTVLATAKVQVPTQSSVPEGWRHVRLTEVARLESGHTPSKRQPDYWGGAIPWVSLHDTEGLDAWEIQTTSQSITEAGLANSSARLLPKGTVVFSRTATVGKSTVMGSAMATSQDFACYVCGPEVHNFYLALLLRSMRAEWKKLMAGSIHNTVYMPVFKTLSVDLPPHGEQVAIANAMRDAERLIDSLEQLLTKKRQIKQGAMQELLTGKRRLPGFSLPWKTYRLEEITDPVTRLNREAAELPVITCSKHLGFVDSLAFFRNQVFSNDTSTYKVVLRGQLAYPANHIEEGSIGYQDLHHQALVSPIYVVFQPRTGTNGKFLHRLLKLPLFLPVFGKFTSSSVDRRGSLRWPAFSTIEVTLPPEEEQLEVVQVIEALESEVSALEARLVKVRALKQAMSEVLLTGRIRLVESNA
jgi:type I restriction enzyme S subunit